MPLTTVERVKTLHGSIQGTNLDTVLSLLVGYVEAAIQQHLSVDLTEGTKEDTLPVRPGQQRFLLRTFPVVSITEVRSAVNGDWAAATVVPAMDYYVDTRRGVLHLRRQDSVYPGPDGLQVEYEGGLPADWQDEPDYAEYLGLDFAAAMQVLAELNRRPNWGELSRSAGSASQTVVDYAEAANTPLLPKVLAHLQQYRRF